MNSAAVDNRVSVPSLAVLMGLVSEVNDALRTFRKSNKYLELFENRMQRLEYKNEKHLTQIDLSKHWEDFQKVIREYVASRLGGFEGNLTKKGGSFD